jgi:23S rRNA (guanosine2251-2'-O)-methyltransferase
VEAFLRARPTQVREVLVASALHPELVEPLRAARIEARVVEGTDLDRRVGGLAHQGVLAAGDPPPACAIEDLLRRQASPLLVIDGVTDPRTSALCSERRGRRCRGGPPATTPRLTPALVKAAAGAVEWLPHARVVNVARLLGQLREAGYWVVGLDAEAPLSIWDSGAFPGSPLALVLGAEGRGLRPLVRRGCHLLASIPMPGRTASLNVAVAAAIALFEVARRTPRP